MLSPQACGFFRADLIEESDEMSLAGHQTSPPLSFRGSYPPTWLLQVEAEGHRGEQGVARSPEGEVHDSTEYLSVHQSLRVGMMLPSPF